jgi:HK97 family phage portal protein
MAGLLTRLRDTVRSITLGPFDSKDPVLARYFSDGGGTNNTGVPVTEYSALNYSALWAAVARIAGDVASLPLILYKREKDGGKSRFTDHPTYALLHDQPNPEMTSMVFRETLQAHLLTWGNAYAEIEWRGNGRPAALWPLPPDRVVVMRSPTGRVAYRVTNPTRQDVMVPAEDMLHIPGLGFDGLMGYSVIRMARESIGLGLATERFGGSFFGNGTTFGGLLKHPGKLSDAARKNLRESIEKRHQGVDRAHKFMLIEEGMDYVKLGVSPDDAQFLETRRFQIAEIARWFQMPPHKLGDLERATFSNIEQQEIDYVTGTLRKWLKRWEQEINRKLVLQNGAQFAEHLVEDMLRGDIQSRYAAYAVGRQWGWLCADDIRERENMNPLPGGTGQIYLVPQNMAPADRINDVIDAQTREPAPPAPPPASDPAAAQAADRARLAEQSRDEAIATLERAREALAALQTSAAATEAERAAAREEVARQQALATQLTAMADELRSSADESRRQRDALQAEWRTAQEAHAERLAVETSARAQAQAALDHQAERALALSDDVADKVRLLDAATEARLDAERIAQEARDRAAQTLSEQLVSVAEAQAARELVALAEARAAAAREAAAVAAAALTEATTARSDAETRMADLQSRLEAMRLDLVQSQDDAAARAAAALKLEADLRAATEDTEAARREAEDQRASRAALQERADHAERALREAIRASADRLAAIVGANRRQYADTVARIVRMEVAQAERHTATPEKLRTWVKNLALTHEARCVEMLSADMAAHLAFMGSDAAPTLLARDVVRDHIAQFTQQLLDVADSDPSDYAQNVDAALRRWEAERPDAVADVFLRQEIDHVRALG